MSLYCKSNPFSPRNSSVMSLTPLFCDVSQQWIVHITPEMSLPKITRLPSVRLLSSIHHHQLLLPSITSLAVPRRSLNQGEYRRPGQPKEDKFPWEHINFGFSKGLEGIKKHFTLMKQEFSDRFVGPEGKPLLEHMLEQNRVIWEFRGPESLEQWTVSSDREIGGQSEVYLKLGKNNNTCFLYGNLSSTPPRDGETRYSGYCSMRSQQPLVSTGTKACGIIQSLLMRFGSYCNNVQSQWEHFSLEIWVFWQPGRCCYRLISRPSMPTFSPVNTKKYKLQHFPPALENQCAKNVIQWCSICL